jgi:hypothetical protein
MVRHGGPRLTNNPRVREPVTRLLGSFDNIFLVEPLDYLAFVYLMTRAHFILTDSGGVQEEAPTLGKPVLVMRDTTERAEAIAAGRLAWWAPMPRASYRRPRCCSTIPEHICRCARPKIRSATAEPLVASSPYLKERAHGTRPTPPSEHDAISNREADT